MFTRLPALSLFLNTLEEGVLFLDKERRVIGINEAAKHMIGRSQENLLDQVCASVFGDTACAGRGCCSLVPDIGRGKKAQDVALERPDGGLAHLRIRALLLPPNDLDLFSAIVLRDRSHEVELEQMMTERLRLRGIVGCSPAMQNLYRDIMAAAGSDATVLITGESGTGKELIARSLHDESPRSAGPYVPVHCAALPEHLLESELFGHARGAFTGASSARAGRFEAAHGGTLLLDEIGEIPTSIQVKLLRVLQEKEIVRLGENEPRRVDVRVIAATHRDLAAMVERGEFREDLYYRLRVLRVHAPPLRESADDILLLANKLLDDLACRYRRSPPRLDCETLSLLEAYDWPGNIRELENALEYAIVRAQSSVILPEHLPPEVQMPCRPARPEPKTAARDASSTRYSRPGTEQDESTIILRVLAETGGNRAEAARRLGMSRTTLWKRLRAIAPNGDETQISQPCSSPGAAQCACEGQGDRDECAHVAPVGSEEDDSL